MFNAFYKQKACFSRISFYVTYLTIHPFLLSSRLFLTKIQTRMIIAIYIYITFLQKIWIFEINNTFFFYFSKKIVKRSMFRIIRREKKSFVSKKISRLLEYFPTYFCPSKFQSRFFKLLLIFGKVTTRR